MNSNIANYFYNKAKDHFLSKEYEETILCIDKAILINPLCENYWSLRGKTLDLLGLFEEAIISYDKAIFLNPLGENNWALNGRIFMKLEKFKEAFLCFENELLINPDNNHFLFEWEFDLYIKKSKNNQEAISCIEIFFGKSFVNKPNDSKFLNFKGNIFYLFEKYEKSIECFEKSILINPNDSAARNNKGFCLYKLEKFQESIEYYNKAISINRYNYLYWNNKGNSLYKLKKFKKSIKCYDKAISIHPNDAICWINKGNSLYKESFECYEKAKSMNPDTFSILNELRKFRESEVCNEILFSIKPSDASDKNEKRKVSHNLEKYEKTEFKNNEKFLLDLKFLDEAFECIEKELLIKVAYVYDWNQKETFYNNIEKNIESIRYFEKVLSLELLILNRNVTNRIHLLKQIKNDESIRFYDKPIKLRTEISNFSNNFLNRLYLFLKNEESLNFIENPLFFKDNQSTYWIKNKNILYRYKIIKQSKESDKKYELKDSELIFCNNLGKIFFELIKNKNSLEYLKNLILINSEVGKYFEMKLFTESFICIFGINQ